MSGNNGVHVMNLLMVGLFVGITLVGLEGCLSGQQATPAASHTRVVMSTVYIAMTPEEVIDQADVVFVGRVLHTSPSRWNQDSGEYWDEGEHGDSGNLLHTIELEILQPIVDTVGLDKQVTITVLGHSPLDDGFTGQPSDTGVMREAHTAHRLQGGEQVVIFAKYIDLPWRNGVRPALVMVGQPSYTHFILADDGLYHGGFMPQPVQLTALIDHIAQRRTVLGQP